MKTNYSILKEHVKLEPSTPTRIVFIDDSKEFLEAATNYLTEFENFSVIGAMTSQDNPVSTTVNLNPDIVIIDLTTKANTGLKTLHSIKTLLPASRVIVTTLFNSPELQARAVLSGADGFINKIFFVDEIVKIVRAIESQQIEPKNRDEQNEITKRIQNN